MSRKTLVKALAFDHVQVSLRSTFIDCNLLVLIVIHEAVISLQFCISRPIIEKTRVGCSNTLCKKEGLLCILHLINKKASKVLQQDIVV